MGLRVKFDNKNIDSSYSSFYELVQDKNYNNITEIWYSALDGTYSIPMLPNSIKRFCYRNTCIDHLPYLPETLVYLDYSLNLIVEPPLLPNNLTELYCSGGYINELPKLPKSLVVLNCSYNEIKQLPELPNKLEVLRCESNNINSLPLLPRSLKEFNYTYNPIHNHIEKKFGENWKKYRKYQYHKIILKVFANKIGEWYLECKYNPKYKYCRERLLREFNETHETESKN